MRSHAAFRTLLLACALACTLPYATAHAGPVPPAWTRDFAAPIEWQRVTAFGQLLVSTRAGLHAVDPATGKVLWNHTDLAGLPEQGLEELAGSPLVLISDRAEVPRTVVLNVFNGQLVQYSGTQQPAALTAAADTATRLAGKIVFDDSKAGGAKIDAQFDTPLTKTVTKGR